MKLNRPFTSIGGQAVIEGVMMRSPRYVAIAVRKANQNILIQSFGHSSITVQLPFLGKPVLRGITMLVESMIQGVEALSFSASTAAADIPITTGLAADSATTSPSGVTAKPPELSSWAIAGSMALAVVMGLGLFVALPHFLAALTSSWKVIDLTAQSPFFHLLDGGFKMLILLSYVYLISFMKDIYRVFQYHGAEHKSIYAFEAGDELTVENAQRYSPLHPRCGTSFLFFLVLISVGVFSVIFPLFHLTELTGNFFLDHLAMIVIKMGLMFPVAGLAYEFIRACAFRMDNPIFRMMIWPGMILQKLTTREPTADQLEIALASLRQVLVLEQKAKAAAATPVLPMDLTLGLSSAASPSQTRAPDQIPADLKKKTEIEVSFLNDLGKIDVRVDEFPEL